MDISVDGGPGPGLQSLWPSLTSLIAVVVACGTRHREPTGRSILIQDRFRATPNLIDNKKSHMSGMSSGHLADVGVPRGMTRTGYHRVGWRRRDDRIHND